MSVSRLNEKQSRALRRIEELMLSGFTGHVALDLSQGGVGKLRESRDWDSQALEEKYPLTESHCRG